MRHVVCLVLIILLLVGALALNGHMYALDRRAESALTTWEEGAATVTESRTETRRSRRRGRSRTRIVAVIRYQYEHGGRAYTGSQIDPLDGHRGTARDAVAEFPQGATVAVWINPDNPSEAFIQRRRPLWPLSVALASAAALPLLVWIGVRTWLAYRRNHPRVPTPSPMTGWWQLHPGVSCAMELGGAALALFFVLPGLPAFLRFAQIPAEEREDWFLLLEGAYAIGALVALGIFVRYFYEWYKAGDMKVLADSPEIQGGRTCQFRLEQSFIGTADVESLVATLRCTRTDETADSRGRKRYSQSTHWEASATPVADRRIEPHDKLAVPVAFDLAYVSAPSSSLQVVRSYPLYEWSLVTEVKLRGRAVFKAEHPVVVRA